MPRKAARVKTKRTKMVGYSRQLELVHKHNSLSAPLTVTHPNLAKEWHPSKNGPYKPEHFTFGSNIRVWWRCPKGPDHVWRGIIQSRTRNGRGCPFCSGRKVSVTNSLKSCYPDIAREWHIVLNKQRTASDITAFSSQYAWWQCRRSKDHVWKAPIANRTASKSNCPYCAGRRSSSENNLARSYPHLAKQWHPTKNGKLKPGDVTTKSSKSVWWQCAAGKDHVWQATVSNRTTNNTGCPFCSGRTATKAKSLLKLFPKLAKNWHSTLNQELKPSDVLPSSNLFAWWQCPKGPDHLWYAKVQDVTRHENGCPFCHGKRVSQTNSLKSLYPAVAAQWHPTKNGDLTPADITGGSRRRVWWQCKKHIRHIWEARIANRTNRKSGCPYCSGRKRLT